MLTKQYAYTSSAKHCPPVLAWTMHAHAKTDNCMTQV
jgi:hypothetical protein